MEGGGRRDGSRWREEGRVSVRGRWDVWVGGWRKEERGEGQKCLRFPSWQGEMGYTQVCALPHPIQRVSLPDPLRWRRRRREGEGGWRCLQCMIAVLETNIQSIPPTPPLFIHTAHTDTTTASDDGRGRSVRGGVSTHHPPSPASAAAAGRCVTREWTATLPRRRGA